MPAVQIPDPSATFTVPKAPELGPFRLRPMAFDLLDDMLTIWSDPLIAKSLGLKSVSREDITRRVMSYIGHWHVHGIGVFAIEQMVPGADGQQLGRYVGETGFFRWQRDMGADFDDFDEMGWTLGTAYQGTGLAGAATRAAVNWYDENRRTRVVCMIGEDNTPSQRVAAKLGFQRYRDVVFHDTPAAIYERAPR